MSDVLSGRTALCSMRWVVVVASLWVGLAHAGLFDDDEARRAILDLRQRIDAGRQSSDLGLQRLQETKWLCQVQLNWMHIQGLNASSRFGRKPRCQAKPFAPLCQKAWQRQAAICAKYKNCRWMQSRQATC